MWGLGEALTSGEKEKIKYELIDELSKPAALILTPVGGNALQKAAKGVSTVVKGGSYKVNNDGEKYLQYAVDPSAGNIIKGTLFGKSSLGPAREWVEREFESLTPEQTEAFRDAVNAGNDSKEEIFDTILGIKHFDTEDGEKPKQAKTRVLFNSGLSDDAIGSLYSNLIASDKERDALRKGDISVKVLAELAKTDKKTEQYTKLAGMNLSKDDALSYIRFLEGESETTAKGNKNTYARMTELINSGADSSTVMRLKADGHNFELAGDLLEAGVKANNALKIETMFADLVPEKDKKSVSELQKTEAVIQSGLKGTELVDALSVVMNDRRYNKCVSANALGVKPDMYVKSLRLCEKYDANQNGKYTQAEVTNMIDKEFASRSSKEKAILWQMLCDTDSAKNNPYDKKIGEEFLRMEKLD